MTREPASDEFISALLHGYPHPKWEWWTDGRRRSRTICVQLYLDRADLTISRRGVGTDGCMSEFDHFSCDVEHLPQLIRYLNRALAMASEHDLIKQPRK